MSDSGGGTHMDMGSRRGIVVLGPPRSGTTLLRRLLDAHPDIASPGETHLFGAASRFLRTDRIGDGLPIGVVTGLGFLGFEEDEVVSRVREMTFSFLDEYAARQGKRRWAEKTAFHAFDVGGIERLLGDEVVYVCIVRHGLDVAASLVDFSDRVGGYLPELHEYIARHPAPLEAFVHAWCDMTRDVLEFAARRDDALLIRYEDLASDTEDVLRTVLSFVGEDWHDDLIAKGLEHPEHPGLSDWKTYATASVHAQSIGRWKRLQRPVLNRLGDIANPTLQAAGYPAVPVTRRASGNEAKRYEMGLRAQKKLKPSQESDS